MTAPTPFPVRPTPAAFYLPPQSMLDKFAFGFLCLFLFLLFGRLADFFFSGLHLPLVTSVCVLVSAILTGGVLLVVRSPIGLLMTALSAWFVVTIPFSTYRGGSFETLTSNWSRAFFCFVLIVAICRQPQQIRAVVRLLGWALFLTSLLGIQFGVLKFGRLQLPVGLLAGPNELAGAMIIGILFLLFIFFDSAAAMIHRVASGLATLPMFYVLLKTGSRGALITLVVVLTFLFFRLSAGKKIMVLLFGTIALVLGLTVLPSELRNRYVTGFASEEQVEDNANALDSPIGSAEHRLTLLKRSITFTFTHPIFGVGIDQFPTYDDSVSRQEGKRKGSWLGTHNTYTQISSETGLPGIALFLAILFMSWRSTGRMQREGMRLGGPNGLMLANTAMALRIVLMSYLLFFMFEHTAYMPFWPAAVGLIAALESSFLTIAAQQPAHAPAAPAMPKAPAIPKTPMMPAPMRVSGGAAPRFRRG